MIFLLAVDSALMRRFYDPPSPPTTVDLSKADASLLSVCVCVCVCVIESDGTRLADLANE